MAVQFLQNNAEQCLIKTEQVIGEGIKQKFVEETKQVPGIKIVDIVPSVKNVRSIVKDGKVIVQGVLHKQIFFIGADGLEHHLAEDIEFSELVDVEPVDPAFPVVAGLNEQTHVFVENLIFEFDPNTGELIQKVILLIEVKVTETRQINITLNHLGPTIKVKVVVGEGIKQKFIREEKQIEAIKIVDIVPRLTNLRTHVKNGKVIVQGVLHKQIFFVGLDNIVHHLAEDIDFSEMVEIMPVINACATDGDEAQDHSVIENLVFEFDPDTGRLIQKVIVRLVEKVTTTQQIPVCISPYGTLIKAEVVVGEGVKQKFIEEVKQIPAIKIVDIVPTLKDITSIVKEGKVIVQGVLHQQIFFVGIDGLVHHVAEDIDFSEMVEIEPLDPTKPVTEGMNEQDHSVIENLVFEFDPDTGELRKKVIIRLEVVVTETQQIRVCA